MRWWKWVGIAGLVGAAAVGVGTGVVAIQRRRARAWTEYEPAALRARLHERFEQSHGAQLSPDPPAPVPLPESTPSSASHPA